MTEFQSHCLDTFPEWLRTLASDALDASRLLHSSVAAESARRFVAGGLNYLFKSLDLIPDGIEDLGFLDDAFVLRTAAALALHNAPDAAQDAPILTRLASEAKVVSEFLGKDYVRLENYVKALAKGAARGRTVDEIVTEAAVLNAFTNELQAWVSSYTAPSFGRDEKNLVKLHAFLSAKLPA
jgi:uncharacterized membrane protein YkvA (DUF1232 family)